MSVKEFFTGKTDKKKDAFGAEYVEPIDGDAYDYDDSDGEAELRRKYSESQVKELAKMFFYAKSASTEEELEGKIKEYLNLGTAKVVKVYLYGDGDDEFASDKELALAAAEKGFRVRPGLARQNVSGELTLMSKNEIREYLKKHPRIRKV